MRTALILVLIITLDYMEINFNVLNSYRYLKSSSHPSQFTMSNRPTYGYDLAVHMVRLWTLDQEVADLRLFDLRPLHFQCYTLGMVFTRNNNLVLEKIQLTADSEKSNYSLPPSL